MGSSGSRVRIYAWADATPDPPYDMQEVASFKEFPGFSTLVFASENTIESYVSDLLQFAVENVPRERHSDTSFFFLATAGKQESQARIVRINTRLN